MDSKRMAALKKISSCPVRSSLVKRAGIGGMVKAETLVKQWDHKTYFEFNVAINQYLMDHFKNDPKVADLCNILSEANGALFQRKIVNK